jgi:hypothetical protein
MAEGNFTTGQAALALGISSYKVRTLCEAGLIDAELTGTGRWKIPQRELAHLQRHGIPEIPREPVDSSDVEADDEETPQSTNGTRPAPKAALYGPPSKQLIASKEKVVRLRNKAEAQDLERQIRQANRADREEQQQRAEARRRKQWIERCLDYSVSRVPKGSGLHAEVRTRVESALNVLRTDDPRTREVVDDIIEDALRPIRRREDQKRAVKDAVDHAYALKLRAGAEWCDRASTAAAQAVRQLPVDASYPEMQTAARGAVAQIQRAFEHSERLERELRDLNLPWDATSDEREEARELACEAVARLPIGASDTQIRTAVSRAIAPVQTKMKARQAEEKREREIAFHRNAIRQIVARVPLPLIIEGATHEEQESAQAQVRAALEELPIGASTSEMEAAKERALTTIKARIRDRKEAERKNHR